MFTDTKKTRASTPNVLHLLNLYRVLHYNFSSGLRRFVEAEVSILTTQ